MKDKDQKNKLSRWKKIRDHDYTQWCEIKEKMDNRELQYRGELKMEPVVDGDKKKKPYHETNLTAEIIEAQIDTNIPTPKVTAKREQNEKLAKIVEDMLRNELDRLSFEEMNDMMERINYIQGGGLFAAEWDNSVRSHTTIGDVTVDVMHPKQLIPQAGIYTNLDDMDHFILVYSPTKESIKRRYGVDVHSEAEEDPNAKAVDGETAAEGVVTQYVAYYRNDKGGIGRFSWVNEVILEDIDDYQARRLKRCTKCGTLEPDNSEPLNMPTEDGKFPGGERDAELPPEFDGVTEKPKHANKIVCPFCGGKEFKEEAEEFEEVWIQKVTAGGVMIPGSHNEEKLQKDENGEPVMVTVEVPTKIPYYKPDIFPVVLQKNVSLFGQLLGDSDTDKIKDQHNSMNRITGKILDKLFKAGSFATLPTDATIRTDNEDLKYIRLESAADKAMIGVYDMEGNVEQDIVVRNIIYQEARNIIGITDSFQGRKDNTATSGTAKQFSASQAAGRLESKRAMKDAAYAKLFEIIFKFKLAYADEQRPVLSRDEKGNTKYDIFDRYDFLEQDENGEWFWNDDFLFSCDTAGALAANREAMWQETRLNLQSGAFGDPSSLDTLILFWNKMAVLHYPEAEATKEYLEKQLEEQKAQQAAQIELQKQALAAKAAQTQAEAEVEKTKVTAADNADARNTVAKILNKGGDNNGQTTD